MKEFKEIVLLVTEMTKEKGFECTFYDIEEEFEKYSLHLIEIDNQITSEHRWYNIVDTIYKIKEIDDKFITILWCKPLTEIQDGQEQDASFRVTIPKEIKTTIYVDDPEFNKRS